MIIFICNLPIATEQLILYEKKNKHNLNYCIFIEAIEIKCIGYIVHIYILMN